MKNRLKIIITSFSLFFSIAFIVFAGFAAQHITLGTNANVSYEYNSAKNVLASITISADSNDAGFTNTMYDFTDKNVVFDGDEANDSTEGVKELPEFRFTDAVKPGDKLTITLTITNNQEDLGETLLVSWTAIDVAYDNAEMNADNAPVGVSGDAINSSINSREVAPKATTSITLVFTMHEPEVDCAFNFSNLIINLENKVTV